MIRRFLIPSLFAAMALSSPAFAAKKGDALAAAAATARATFATGMRTADKTFATAAAGLTKGVLKKTTAADVATNEFGAALAFYATSVKRLADAVSASITSDATTLMTGAADEQLKGAVEGDGGSLDVLSEYVQTSLEGARRKTLGRAKAFAAALSKVSDSVRGQTMTVVLPEWTFDRRAAPNPTTALTPKDEPIRLLAALATHLDAGFVVVTLAGGAPASADGNFDVRLVNGTDVRGVGNLLSAGGMPVVGRTWSVTASMNGPPLTSFRPLGNHLIEFGVDPFDGGLAGRQPGNLLHAGVIGID